ncbi:MAG: hypothetical protein IPP87_05390 [Ideonella sp.]|nr:hypothetical protein [Ideonella sp.]
MSDVHRPSPKPGPTLGAALPVRSGTRAPRGDDGPVLRACPMCGSGSPPRVWPDTRCAGCDSPLAMPLDPVAHSQDKLQRRGALRRDRDHLARMHIGWPSAAVPVRWRDLSLTGLSLICEQPVPLGCRIRVIDEGFDGVAEVVGCAAQGRYHQLHGRLLSAMYLRSSGVFVSIKA